MGWQVVLYGRIYVHFSSLTVHKVCTKARLLGGEQELTAACEAIGYCDLGKAVCTPAFGLPAKYIFHAVCPAWQGGIAGEAEQLAGAYHAALELAIEYGEKSKGKPRYHFEALEKQQDL